MGLTLGVVGRDSHMEFHVLLNEFHDVNFLT